MKIRYLLILIPFLVLNFIGFSQVVINEYSASNLNSFTDSFGKTEDWVELYNTSTSAVDMSGWYLSDKENNPMKWQIPSGTVIEGNSFLTILCSGRDGVFNDEYHCNFKLAQTTGKDKILLADDVGIIQEIHDLDITLVEHSRCRIMDGSDQWRVSTDPSFGSSNNFSSQVDGYTVAPTMSLAAGFYEESQVVELTNNEPNSVLRYTLDGTNPTSNSPIYEDAITLNQTTVIKAQAFSNDAAILPGKMDFNTYFINEDFSLAVFSVAADDVIELANGNGNLIPIGSLEYFNLNQEREATTFGSLNRHGQDSWVLDHRSLDWVSRDEMGYSKAIDAPLFNISERDEYQKIMFRNSGDDNYPAIDDFAHQGSTHIRDEYVQNLAHYGDMKLDIRHVERVVVFLNGQYWGVYGMRDRPVDHDYTDYYYDQGKFDIQYLSTWGTTEIEYGGIAAMRDWEQLRNFILDNDMSSTENYQIAEDSLNMTSLIDYMLMNLNVVASDWLNYNTGWWRGRNPEGDHKKWGYILWDLDATFDYYINYTGVPNTDPDAVPCDLEIIGESMNGFFGTETTNHGGGAQGNLDDVVIDTSIVCQTVLEGTSPYPITDTIFQLVIQQDDFCCENDWDDICQSLYNSLSGEFGGSVITDDIEYGGNVGRHERILLKLLDESPEFTQLYYTRYADLMNSVFTCENMNTLLDSMLAVIEPEMPRQVQRWGGTVSEWESNVNQLKDFVNERCTLLDEGAIECYDDIEGPYTITLLTEPDGVGEIDFNSLDIEEFPWTGDYFGGVENNIKARVFDEFDPEYEFSHWISSEGNEVFPDVNERKATFTMTTPGTLTAVFKETGLSNTDDMASIHQLKIYPNPASDFVNLVYELDDVASVRADLYSVSGTYIKNLLPSNTADGTGKIVKRLSLREVETSGLYIVEVQIGDKQQRFKLNIVK